MTNADGTLDELMAHCPEMLFIASDSGEIVRVSGALERALPRGVEPGTRIHDLIHPHDKPAFEATWATTAEGGDAATLRCRLRAEGGGFQACATSLRRAPGSGRVHGSLRPEDRRA